MSHDDALYEWYNDEPMLTLDGFDGCDMGLCVRYGQQPIIIYSKKKCIIRLMQDGMSHEEACEYFDFNVIGAWMGDGTPAFFMANDDY